MAEATIIHLTPREIAFCLSAGICRAAFLENKIRMAGLTLPHNAPAAEATIPATAPALDWNSASRQAHQAAVALKRMGGELV